ncbi:hypothetical protein FQR65_LT15127 [Abscondita terminalis]|nr:hypothetical protein FQR65_LT15127 [Abscondita terminalis]
MHTNTYVLIFLTSLTLTVTENVPEDAKLLVPQLIRKYGYPCEAHRVVTEDGYVLTVHRIPPRSGGNKGPVLLQHGLLLSSADWIVAGPQKALGYILADAGYDVWLGNSRGSTYSRHHTRLSPNGKEFWDFSWHEIGVYDMPAIIDHILSQTSRTNLYYVGHSQGTTAFYVMCSEKPEYNRKIKLQISLAPSAYMNHITSPLILKLIKLTFPLDKLTSLIGEFEFLPSSTFKALIGKLFCSDGILSQTLCSNILFSIFGYNEQQMNATLVPIIAGHSPAGASVKQLLHFAQLIKSGKFRQYDEGELKNVFKYGSSVPPSYHIENITSPVYLYKSRNDWLSNEIDVNRLRRRLLNVKGEILIGDPQFNHIDYLYAINAPTLVYNLILSHLREYP